MLYTYGLSETVKEKLVRDYGKSRFEPNGKSQTRWEKFCAEKSEELGIPANIPLQMVSNWWIDDNLSHYTKYYLKRAFDLSKGKGILRYDLHLYVSICLHVCKLLVNLIFLIYSGPEHVSVMGAAVEGDHTDDDDGPAVMYSGKVAYSSWSSVPPVRDAQDEIVPGSAPEAAEPGNAEEAGMDTEEP